MILFRRPAIGVAMVIFNGGHRSVALSSRQ
jgi:hypothetical protein